MVTVCFRFGSLGLVKQLNFCSVLSTKFSQDFEVEVKAGFEAGFWSVVSADVL